MSTDESRRFDAQADARHDALRREGLCPACGGRRHVGVARRGCYLYQNPDKALAALRRANERWAQERKK